MGSEFMELSKDKKKKKEEKKSQNYNINYHVYVKGLCECSRVMLLITYPLAYIPVLGQQSAPW